MKIMMCTSKWTCSIIRLICPLACLLGNYGTISIAIFAGNEASVNNLGEQMDIKIKNLQS